MKISNSRTRGIYFRSIRNARFKAFNTAILDEKDRSLSWSDVGIYYFVMSRGEGWQLHMNDLISRKSEKEYAITQSLKRLRKAGYCVLVQVRKCNVIRCYRYDFFEMPLADPQKKMLIENHDAHGKLIKPQNEVFPHMQKPSCGVSQLDFPQTEKPSSGALSVNGKKHNGVAHAKNEGISKCISSIDSLLEEKTITEKKDIYAFSSELDLVQTALHWWEEHGAAIFTKAQGFSARELSRYELQAIGEQIRAISAEDFTQRYAVYHTLKEKIIIDAGYDIWQFLKRLDKLGMIVKRNAPASARTIRAESNSSALEDLSIEDLMQRFCTLNQ